MKKTCIFLLMLLTSSAANAFDLMGSTQINRLYKEGFEGVRYRIKTPYFDIKETWIKYELSIINKKNHELKNPLCSLRKNLKHEPSNHHDNYHGDGLYLYFDTIKANTLIEFIISWEKPTRGAIFPYNAAINIESNQWEKAAKRKLATYYNDDEAQNTQIIIEGAEECRLTNYY